MAIPHPREIQVAVVNWLDERYPFTKAVDEALYQRVPNFANAFYYCFGGMVFILVVLQLLAGVFLSFYYVPAAGVPGNSPAYNSVQFIQNTQYLGWLIRGVHFWGANILIVMVLIHMSRVYWTGSYRAPRAELDRRCPHAAVHPWPLPDGLSAALGHQGLLRHRGHHQDRRSNTSGAVRRRLPKGHPPGRPRGGPADTPALLHDPCVPAAGVDHPADVHPFPLHSGARHRGAAVSTQDIGKEGPGAALPAQEIQIVEVDSGHAGHTLEPEWKRLPIGPDHILYPVVVGLALFPILMGDAGHHLADDMPDDETHPFFPDHFWPYPIIAVIMLITVGLLSFFVQKNLQLELPADPRAVTVPRPDWSFLLLFQLLKLGPRSEERRVG